MKRPAFEIGAVPSRMLWVGDAYLEVDLTPAFSFEPALSRDKAAMALGEPVKPPSGFPALYLFCRLPCEVAVWTWLFLLLARPGSIGERGATLAY